jgi:hypothetical protein
MKKIFFSKITMQMSHYWKIYHETKKGLENMDMPTGNRQSGKSHLYLLQSQWSIGYSGCSLSIGIGVQILMGTFYKFGS